jgi:hypothetical protein
MYIIRQVQEALDALILQLVRCKAREDGAAGTLFNPALTPTYLRRRVLPPKGCIAPFRPLHTLKRAIHLQSGGIGGAGGAYEVQETRRFVGETETGREDGGEGALHAVNSPPCCAQCEASLVEYRYD